MGKYFNIISVILLIINLVVYILFFNGIELISEKATFYILVSGSVIGIILSWFGNKGILRNIGILGNTIGLVLIVIIPLLVRIFIWNRP